MTKKHMYECNSYLLHALHIKFTKYNTTKYNINVFLIVNINICIKIINISYLQTYNNMLNCIVNVFHNYLLNVPFM